MFGGCASIVSKSTYPISITSKPNKTEITVVNRKGDMVYHGTTPALVLLKSGQSFFKRAEYEVQFQKQGYQSKKEPIKFRLDPWYFGNILFGGAIGMLIIDPASGAMYRLKTPFVIAELEELSASKSDQKVIKVYLLNEISESWKHQLIPIN